MAKVIPLQRAVKVLCLALFALVAILAGGALGDRLISNASAPESARWIGVTVAILALVPWLFLIIWGVGLGDEFVRQIALIGTAVAFVGDLLVHVGITVAR